MFSQSKTTSSLSKILAVINQLPQQLVYEKKLHHAHKKLCTQKNYLPPALAECACANGFNRSTCDTRNNLESLILAEVTKRFSTTKELNYLSLGAGYLLQDFIICARLIEKGYSLRVILVEPELDLIEFKAALAQFKTLEPAATENKLSLTVACFKNIIDYIKKYPNEKVHLASGIDFGGCDVITTLGMYDDIILTYQMIRDDGIFYLSLADCEYFYDKATVFFHRNRFTAAWSLIFDEQAKQIPAINTKLAAMESGIAEATALPEGHIVKNILLYTGFFKQGPVFENLQLLEIENLKKSMTTQPPTRYTHKP